MLKVKGLKIDAMVQGYLAAELWAGSVIGIDDPDIDQTDLNWERESPLLDNLGYTIENFSVKALIDTVCECKEFYKVNANLLDGCDLETVGHDFMLTRNGHGAGFWDGDYQHGAELTKASKTYGSTNLYVDSNGEISFI